MRARIALLAALLVPNVALAQETETWTVKAGDTCSSIAEEFYGDARFFTSIHRANDLGAPPHVLRPGQKLILPVEADARLQQKRGKVQAQAPKAKWESANEGLELYRAWRLNTLDHARALVGFRDDSELVLRENTLIVIYGDASRSQKKRGGRAVLESGALRSRLAELSGVTVETPTATADLSEGSAVVAVDPGATTRVSNHEGGSTKLASKSHPKAAVAVDAGFGSKVDKGKPPTKPKPLPPAPQWQSGPREFATLANTAVTASWKAVDVADQYFVELTADSEGVQVMQAAYVGAEVTKLEVRGLPAGKYFATVSSIDSDGFESIPAKRIELTVAKIEAPPGSLSTSEPLRFYAGTHLAAPDGFKCRTGDGEFGAEFAVKPVNAPRVEGVEYPGYAERMEVECQGPNGTTREPIEVEIPPFSVDAEGLELFPGEVRMLGLTFERGWLETAAEGPGLDVLTMKNAARSSRMRVTASDDVGSGVMTIAAGGTPILDVSVSRSEAPPAEGTIPVGVGGGATGFGTPAAVLGSTDSTAGIGGQLFAMVDVAPWFTMHSGLGFIEVLGSSNVFAIAPSVEARFALPGDIRPYAALGARAWFPLGDGVHGSFEPGLGTTIGLGDWALDLRGHATMFGGDGKARVAPGLSAGIFRRF